MIPIKPAPSHYLDLAVCGKRIYVKASLFVALKLCLARARKNHFYVLHILRAAEPLPPATCQSATFTPFQKAILSFISEAACFGSG